MSSRAYLAVYLRSLVGLSGVVLLFLAYSNPAAGNSTTVGIPAEDVIVGAQNHASAKSAFLESSLSKSSVADFDTYFGVPTSITPVTGTLTTPSDDAPSKIALDYIEAHSSFFKLSVEDIASLNLVESQLPTELSSISQQASQLNVIEITQNYKGIHVFGAKMVALINQFGEILRISGIIYPGVDILTEPSLNHTAVQNNPELTHSSA